MSLKFRSARLFAIAPIAVTLVAAVFSQCSTASAQTVRPTTITRLFWRDRETEKLSYADLTTTNKWNLNRGWIKGFPALDAAKQSVGSISYAGGILMVGVCRGENDGLDSGWLAIESGAFEEPHGSHNHWKYTRVPEVKSRELNTQQGNPSALSVYDDTFYLASEVKHGFIQATPQQLKTYGSTSTVRSFPGGGGGALAVVDKSVCYATWNDAAGDDAGRVDVVNLQGGRGDQVSYSFNLPSGSIQGATANTGKVFFAPADGICWVNADTSASQTGVSATAVSLGQDADTGEPLRTSAFASQRNWVMFTTGSGSSSSFCLINAAMSAPSVVKLPISVADGLSLTDPQVALSLGKRYAFMFQDRIDAASSVQEMLTIVELDPNRDQDFSDAVVKLTMPVGSSKVDGSHGHHSVCFDAYGRHAVITNPGDGVLTILSLQNMKVQARFQVGGVPEGTVAVGAAEHFH